jgi:lycopene beta-cyclase
LRERDYDLIVLGAGCAGLSLAHYLSRQPAPKAKVLFLEARNRYVHDRVWCHWKSPKVKLDERWIQRRWHRMTVGDGWRTVTLKSDLMPYTLVESGDFYRCVQEDIRSSPHLDLRLGVNVSCPQMRHQNVHRVNFGHESASSRYVLDTRPQLGSLKYPGMWQSFIGWEIECVNDVFDVETVTLMEFVRPSRYVLEFVYILPMTAKRALVEWTVFDPRPLDPESFSDFLRQKIKLLVGTSSYRRIRCEKGILPMGEIEVLSPKQCATDISLGSGMSRMATGYCFSNIQRWASHCAAQVESVGVPCGPLPRPRPIQWMDELFMKRLRAHSDQAPDFLMDLFEGTDPDALLGFLEGHSSPRNLMAVMLSQVPGFMRGRQIPFHTSLF